MCLFIGGFKTKKEAIRFKPKTAERNITVQKIVYKTENPNIYKSLYYWFTYERGMHYYQVQMKGDPKFSKSVLRSCNYWILAINKGLHSYNTKLKPYNDDGSISIECIIPKGSKYYKNGYEIVSDQLIIC